MALFKEASTTARVDVDGMGELTAFMDEGSEFSGKLSFRGAVRIDGHFEGEIASESTLIVGETGVVRSEIRSKVVIVSGEVHGNIFSEVQVILRKTGKVVGDVFTGSLVVEDGAQYNGRLQMKV